MVRAFPDHRDITALAMVLGEVSLAVGDSKGGLTTWFPVSADSTRKLRLIHQLSPHQAEVRRIVPSSRNKTLVSQDGDGAIHFDYMTSERCLLSIAACGAGVSPARNKAGEMPAPTNRPGNRAATRSCVSMPAAG